MGDCYDEHTIGLQVLVDEVVWKLPNPKPSEVLVLFRVRVRIDGDAINRIIDRFAESLSDSHVPICVPVLSSS